MNLYRIKRKSDGKFMGSSKAEDKHDTVGKFYITPYMVRRAIKSAGRNHEDYTMITYLVKFISEENITQEQIDEVK